LSKQSDNFKLIATEANEKIIEIKRQMSLELERIE